MSDGRASFSFSDSPASFFIETVYIDHDGSHTLNYGDRVWGTNGYDFSGFCINAAQFGQDILWNWDSEADSSFGGSTVYLGSDVNFRSGANFLVVSGNGNFQ